MAHGNRALALSILESKQSALAVEWRLAAGVFDGSVHRPCASGLLGGQRGAVATDVGLTRAVGKRLIYKTA